MTGNQDDWLGLVEGDIVKVIGGFGPIDALPNAKIIVLGYAGDNGSPSVMVEYLSCPPGCPGALGKECDLVRWRREGLLNRDDNKVAAERSSGHVQEWYPNQVKKVMT